MDHHRRFVGIVDVIVVVVVGHGVLLGLGGGGVH
tara:strand:+ start:179 stop:280 length:102 start_codon:yes stop_codon:yes gene_type:complete